VNAPNTPKQIPHAQPVAGFTAPELQRFLSKQLFTLSHYASMVKEGAKLDEDMQTGFNNIADVLFQLHELVDNADLMPEAGQEP
jgi:hypothetical protein